ncbi:MAG: LemA family protein [Angelakisella sp.]
MANIKGMSMGLKILLVVVAILVVLGIVVVGQYNGLVSGEEAVLNSFANIDVQLQRRNDLIPNLVTTVKGYAAHEQGIIDSVTNARAKMMGAGSIDEKIAADNELSGALSRLIAISESYPDLKANENFLSLQDELAGTENRISVSRKDYNDTVMGFNRKLRTFPTNLLAGMFGFEKYNAFTAAPEAAAPPVVSFGG